MHTNARHLILKVLLTNKIWLAFRNCVFLGEEAGTSDKVQMVRNEVDRVKDIMVANVETLMDRGERLELLVDKTENLSQHSVSFRRAGTYIDHIKNVVSD